MAANTPVEIPKSHRNEWKSKRNFEDLIENLGMYMPFGWAIRDYGIDGQVEITRPIKDSDSFRPESKFFLLQLKSIEKLKVLKKHISFSVPVKKVIQWYSANLPVMFVLNDLQTKTFYTQWIDEKLINHLENSNPNWINQDDITIKISIDNSFGNYTLDSIRDYVLSWRVSSKKIIEAGTYFELKDKCKANLNLYSEICKPFKFESSKNSIVALNNQLEQAIYRIAITGPSRVGKSTLINALLNRKDISPTGMEQTTAVPIQILPGKQDLIEIKFRSGFATSKKFSTKIIKEFASQELNEDNKKEVALVVIHLANRQLEQGVSLFDIPGLDDPDENIYNYTWNTVTKANAILYLIDGSVYENGGYIFRREYKNHILELGQSLDKIFLVFNKVNALTGNKLELLKDRVTKDLQKLNLYEKVSDKIYFISSEESLEVRTNKKKGNDSVKKLEDDIWAFLLRENKIGLVNLSYINKDIIKSTIDFEGLLNARLLDNANRGKLESTINTVKTKIPELSQLYYSREREIKLGITKSLELRKNTLLLELENYLKSFSPSVDLPGKTEMRNYLTVGGHKTLEETNKEYFHQMNLQKELIDKWIEENLKQVREIISGNTEQRIVDFSDINNFEPPTIDLSNSFGVGFLAGALAFLINPLAGSAALFTGVSAFFGNLLLSASERRAKRITKTMEAARRSYNEQFKKINTTYLACIDENSIRIIDYANKKINSFLKDIQDQTKKLSTPISIQEESQYKEAFSKIEKLRTSINKLSEEINSWYASV